MNEVTRFMEDIGLNPESFGHNAIVVTSMDLDTAEFRFADEDPDDEPEQSGH